MTVQERDIRRLPKPLQVWMAKLTLDGAKFTVLDDDGDTVTIDNSPRWRADYYGLRSVDSSLAWLVKRAWAERQRVAERRR